MSDFKVVKLLGAPVEINFPGNINYTGAYSNVTAYVTGDAVSYLGSSYVALGATTGNIPTNTSFWQLLAEKGDAGPAGPSGTSTFTALTDVPNSYAGQSLKTVRVNAGATGLEFITAVDTDEKVKVSSNDTTAKYLEDAITVSHGTNASTVLAKTTLNDGGDEDVQIQFDVSKVDLSLANNTTSDFASKSYADAKVADSITDGIIAIAPSQNAVFDALATKEPSISSGTTAQYWRGDKSFQTLDKAAVGLGSVDNTSDASKPISTATQDALDDKVAKAGDTMTGNLQITSAGTISSSLSTDGILVSDTAAPSDPAYYNRTGFAVKDQVNPAYNAYLIASALNMEMQYQDTSTLSYNLAQVGSYGIRLYTSPDGIIENPQIAVNPEDVTTKAYVDDAIDAIPYANDTLSNLGSTAVNNSINPDSNITHTLGASGLNWLSVATKSILYDDTPNYDVELRNFVDSTTKNSLNYEARNLLDKSGALVLDWDNCTIDQTRFGLTGVTFETVSKNLRQYNYALNYTSGVLTSIVYTVPTVGTITKTLNYTSGLLTSVVLSGSTPLSISLTKTLTYTSGVLTSVAYS